MSKDKQEQAQPQPQLPQHIQLEARVAQRIRQFMNQTQLQGTEVQDWMGCVQQLDMALQQLGQQQQAFMQQMQEAEQNGGGDTTH